MPGGLPLPNANFQNIPGPETGLILRFDAGAGHWEDELGRNWDNAVRFSLPDRDVFAINANNLAAAPTPFVGVGTILFNMVTNPVSGKVYVSNTEARNEVRFEGPGNAASTVRGHLHEARITVLDGANVLPRHLNPHIDYDVVPSPIGREGREPGDAARHGRDERREHALRRRVRLVEGRGVRHDRAGERHLHAERRRSHHGSGRRTERTRAERGGRSSLRRDPLRQRDLGHRHHRRDRGRAPLAAQSGARRGRRRPSRPVRRPALLQQRRGGVRELPHLRRLRQPRLGPRQPGRRAPEQPEPVRGRQRRALPSHEGSHDHAEPARHGEPRPDALAGGSDRRQRPGRQRARRERGVQQVHRRL